MTDFPKSIDCGDFRLEKVEPTFDTARYLFELVVFFKKKIEGTGNMGEILWLFDIYDFSALDKGDK